MKRNSMMKKAIAGIAAVTTLASVTPAMAATAPFALRADSVLTTVTEGDTRYILGPAVDGGWTYNDLFDQMEEDTAVLSMMTGTSLTDTLVTGYEKNTNGDHIVTVVKGDVTGSGKWSISQLVAMVNVMSNPQNYTRAQQMAADVTGDGKVQISDLVAMAGNKISGIAPDAAAPIVEATPEATPEATLEPTVEPTVEPTAEPTVEPTVEPTTVPTVEPTVEVTELSLQEQNEMMLELVNELRASEGVAPVRLCPQLMQVANVRATESAYAHIMNGHARPDGSACFTAMEGGYFSENSGSKSGNVVDALYEQFDGWDKCEGHHHNMVNPKWTTTGFAMVQTDEGIWTCIQVFSDDRADNITWIDDPILVEPKHSVDDMNPDSFKAYVEFVKETGYTGDYGEYLDNYWNK